MNILHNAFSALTATVISIGIGTPAFSQAIPERVKEGILKAWVLENCLVDYEIELRKALKARDEYEIVLGLGDEKLRTLYPNEKEEGPMIWILQDKIRQIPGWEKDYADTQRKMTKTCSMTARTLGSKAESIDYSQISGRQWYERAVAVFARDKCLEEFFQPKPTSEVVKAVRKIMSHDAEVPYLVTPYDMQTASKRSTFNKDLSKQINIYLYQSNRCSKYLEDLRPMILDLQHLYSIYD